MTFARPNGIQWAIFAAVFLHVLLFLVGIRPVGNARKGMPEAPATSYFPRGDSNILLSGYDIRLIKSPIIFSLPTAMGFSHELEQQDVATSLNTVSQPTLDESFLTALPTTPEDGKEPLVSSGLTVLTDGLKAPDLPSGVFQKLEQRPSARRVNMAPELMARLEGGVILPPELNQEVEKPWEVRAAVSISEQGLVEHVFFEEPLDSAQLNHQVLLLLHGLNFKPGKPMESLIEIYSPEASVKPQEAP